MRKRIFTILLALLMVVSLLPMAAMAAGEKAQIVGGSSYATLADAITNAAVGDTVKLLADVTITEQLYIGKAITLDGNGKTITRTPGGASAEYKAGILVGAGATIKNLTVSGPNTTASGWDGGEFGIKLYQASGAVLENVTVKSANAGIQVNGGSVTFKGTIDVSGNEYGGIELLHEGTLDISNAILVNKDETEATPVLWNDDDKGTITFNKRQTLEKVAVDETKDHYYIAPEPSFFENLFNLIRFKKTTDDIKTFSIVTLILEFITNIINSIFGK